MVSTTGLLESPVVDCRGMMCPAPILKLAEAAKRYRDTGATLTILASDMDFPVDLEAWCRTTKASLVRLEHESDGVIRALVRVPGSLSALSGGAPIGQRLAPTNQRLAPVSQRLAPSSRRPAPASQRTIPAGPRPAPASAGLYASVTTPRSPPLRANAPGASESPLSGRPTERAPSPLRLAPAPAIAEPVSSMPPTNRMVRSPQAAPVALDNPLSGLASPVLGPALLREVEKYHAREAAARDLQEAPSHVYDSRAPAQDAAPQRAAILPLPAPDTGAAPRENRVTLLILRNDLEVLLAALMMANASAAQGMSVEIYFAFWGIHLLRGERPRPGPPGEKPGLLQRMLLWMVPGGPSRQKLGKLHMGGIGTRILLRLMKKRSILALDKLLEAAATQGVKFRVCSMSMGLMGLSQRDIVDLPNVDFAGVTSFSEVSARSAVSLVF